MEQDTLYYSEEGFDSSEFILYLFGTEAWEYVLAGFVFAMIGILLSYLLQGDSENKELLHKKNHKRFVVSILVVILALRFSTEILDGELTMWWALVFGLASDKLVEVFAKIKQGTNPMTAISSAFRMGGNQNDPPKEQ